MPGRSQGALGCAPAIGDRSAARRSGRPSVLLMDHKGVSLWRRPTELVCLVLVVLVVCGIGIPVAADHGWLIATATVVVAEAPIFAFLVLYRRRRAR